MTAAQMGFPEAWRIAYDHAAPGVLLHHHSLWMERVARTVQWLSSHTDAHSVALLERWKVPGAADADALVDLYDLSLSVIEHVHMDRHAAATAHLQQLHADVQELVGASLAIGAVDDSDKLAPLAVALDALALVAARIHAAATAAAASARGEP